MNKATNAPKSATQVAAGQLKKIAKLNQATTRGAMAGAVKKFGKALQPKR